MTRMALLVALPRSAAVPAFAQHAAKMPLVGVLRINTLATNEPGATMLRDALAAVGRVEGDNLRLEFRLAEGHAERYPALVEQLVRDGASVIIAYGMPPVRAAGYATTTIPIVAVAYDLVDAGLIASLARPGGNITGVSILGPELDTKKLDILKEILPAARRFGVLTEPAYPSGAQRQNAFLAWFRCNGRRYCAIDFLLSVNQFTRRCGFPNYLCLRRRLSSICKL